MPSPSSPLRTQGPPASSQRVANVHDSTVRSMLGTPEVASAFFSVFLPSGLTARMDLRSLEPRPEHFIDPRLGWRATDLLFRVTLDQRDAFLYLLLEHQSSPDRWMPWRLMRSIGLIWNQVLDDEPKIERLPWVVPVVLSQAREAWPGPMQLQELVGTPGDLPADMHDKVPSLSYFVFDLRSMTDSQIFSLATSASLRLFLLIMRNIRSPELPDMLRQWHALIAQLMHEPTGLHVIELLLTYLAKAATHMTQETLKEFSEMANLDPELDPNSLASRWLQEGLENGRTEGFRDGWQEGRQEGRDEGAQRVVSRMVRARFGDLPSWVEERVRAASFEELDRLSERLMLVERLEDLFPD